MACSSGRVKPGDKLVASVGGELVLAEVADSYAIRLSNGDEVESPSRAAVRVNELATGKHHSINGWTYWLVGEAGPLLVDVRVQYLMYAERAEGIDPRSFVRRSGTGSSTTVPTVRTLWKRAGISRIGMRTPAGTSPSAWAFEVPTPLRIA